eukprot:CAMPEP_0176120198 /NCGR_PEP_ID=MMETSP0120_2-20121206/60457_1 /TAXON_ID=160619 /ORGANISM="Kryptoperidinium foliaceum, Strain CCMP 1326" /LENGTH=435 /DNA_ID=CAMNT_0017454647 /DNA_START=76 /DNA_END=1383 /DNA_ORIENTATION=+
MLQSQQPASAKTSLDDDKKCGCDSSDVCVSHCAAYGNVCPCHARAAAKAACKKISDLLYDSKLFPEGEPSFRKVNISEIEMGERLGEGGFSMVASCTFKDSSLTPSQPLAIKYLKRRIMVEKKCFEYGAADLANEAFFLGRLNHPNIITLHAVTEGKVENNISTGKDACFFIIVDQLVDTLDKRMERWQKDAKEQHHSLFYRLSREYKETQRLHLKERVKVALDIAKIMKYLHSLDLVFRDLKPDNLGFAADGTLKLFDFGLCKELKKHNALDDGTYKMTGHTGSRRYMAPEVALDRPYNNTVDVYSFGILLWEMCALEKPFAGFNCNRHMREVVIAGDRPKMDSAHTAHWPIDLQWIMNSSWSSDPASRPSFETIVQTLQHVVEELESLKAARVRSRSEGNATESSQSSVGGKGSQSPMRKGPRILKIPGLISI